MAAAGRPLVLVAPPDCDVARVVDSAGCGLVVPNGDATRLAAVLRELQASPGLRSCLGASGAAFAARHDLAAARASWLRLLAALEAC